MRIKYYLSLGSVGILVFCGGVAPGRAQIYKYVQNGVVHYTNQQPVARTYEVFRDATTGPVVVSSTVRTTNIQTKKATPKAASQQVAYLDAIHKIAAAYQLNPELVKAIIKVESNYNHQAVSRKGAQGLMQLMPATAKRFGVSDVLDPEDNINGGAKFLRFLLDEFGENNLELVLAGYNAGEQAVRKYGNQIPPYAETRQYIEQVLAHYLPASKSAYKKTLADSIYRYIGKNGVLIFTNVPKVN